MSIKYCALATQYYNEATKILNQNVTKKMNEDKANIQAINSLKELVEEHGYEVTISKKDKAITDQLDIDTQKKIFGIKNRCIKCSISSRLSIIEYYYCRLV